MESYKCPICGNTDIHSIGMLNGKLYCRRCISFRGEEVEHKVSYPKKAPIHLEYEISPEQKELSNKLVENYKKGIDSLVFAVCGSGKTEIVLSLISYVIEKGGTVAFAIPRRDVVIELAQRLSEIFKDNEVVSVYGGYTNELKGHIVCLTTHQLFRYPDYFDLLIIDEIDAFPYKGNDVLKAFSKRSRKCNSVFLSATVSKEEREDFIKNGGRVLELFVRHHRYPLPVPVIKTYNSFLIYLGLVCVVGQLLKSKKPLFVFAPTIRECERIFRILHLFFKRGDYVHSKRTDRNKVIEQFKHNKNGYLVTTAVLERGVTLEGLQVVVFKADHFIYDAGSLVQIAGRVGRKTNNPFGEVIFLVNEKTKETNNAIKDIERANEYLQNLF